MGPRGPVKLKLGHLAWSASWMYPYLSSFPLNLSKYPCLPLSALYSWLDFLDWLPKPGSFHHLLWCHVDGWQWLFHQHICPVQPLLEHDPFHGSTACAGDTISSWLSSFMKAACPFQSLMLVWTSFSYCQKCFFPLHYFLGGKKKEQKWVLSGKPINTHLQNQRMMKNKKT